MHFEELEEGDAADAPPLATCRDGVQSEDETDVDCGGSCAPCELCRSCNTTDDCTRGVCLSNQCRMQQVLDVDWVTNCVESDAEIDTRGAVFEGFTAGQVQVRALPGAGSLWDADSLDGTTTGYVIRTRCSPINASALRTPPGEFYLGEEEAFAAIEQTVVTVDHPGGDIVCWAQDSVCQDNLGSTPREITQLCP